jgi:hypothetical protein
MLPVTSIGAKLGRRRLLAVLAKIGTESENAVFAVRHFQCLGGTENGRPSCPAGNAEYFGVSLAD